MANHRNNHETQYNFVRHPTWWQRRTISEKILIFVCILIVIAVITLAITLYVADLLNDGSQIDKHFIDNDALRPEALTSESTIAVGEAKAILKNVCLSAGCIHTASTLLKSIDTSVDPCDDFYNFACGQFRKTTNIPEDKTKVNLFSLVNDKLQEQTSTVLNEESQPGESKAFILAKNLYQSCLNTSIIEERGLTPLTELIESYGGWPVVVGDSWETKNPDWDWKDVIVKFRRDGLQKNQIFEFTVSTNLTNSNIRSIELDQSSLGLDLEYLRRGLNDKFARAYYEYMVDLSVLSGANRAQAEIEILDALYFEQALANISTASEDRRNIAELNNPYSLKQIQEKYSFIDWLPYVNSLLSDGLVVTKNEIIAVTAPGFFANLGDVLSRTPKRTIANYLMYRVASFAARYMTTAQRERRLQFLSRISGQQLEKPRWKECVLYVSISLPTSVGALYVRKYFSEESRSEALDMVENIREEFLSLVSQLTWMDEETKTAAIAKAKGLVPHIGYPNELADNSKMEQYYGPLEIERDNLLLNLFRIRKFDTDFKYGRLREPVNKTDWLDHANPAMVNAFYGPLENSIQFPAGILQDKFFDASRPRYMNFGAIGAIVGHEITHGFDDLGSQFDLNGNLVKWWGEETRERFLEKANCIIEQYSNYTEPLTKLPLNGKNTQGENIADNGGVKEAYQAYKRWTAKNGPEDTLPGLNYTAEQLFWISYSQTWCSVAREQHLNLKVTTDSHSPNRYRVNGPLSNMLSFASDYQCPPGSLMNPTHKCEVW